VSGEGIVKLGVCVCVCLLSHDCTVHYALVSAAKEGNALYPVLSSLKYVRRKTKRVTTLSKFHLSSIQIVDG